MCDIETQSMGCVNRLLVKVKVMSSRVRKLPGIKIQIPVKSEADFRSHKIIVQLWNPFNGLTIPPQVE